MVLNAHVSSQANAKVPNAELEQIRVEADLHLATSVPVLLLKEQSLVALNRVLAMTVCTQFVRGLSVWAWERWHLVGR